MTCRQLYLEARRRLSQAGIDSPGVDAALLSQRFLGLDRPGLALHGEEEPAPEQAAAFLQVGEGVLCPREDTAVLVESLAQGLQGRPAPRGLDLCAGTGAVALGLLAFLPGAVVQCVELSDKAFPYLEENLRRHGKGQVTARKGDILSPALAGEFAPGSLDFVASNPPYIETGELATLQPEVRREPALALDGGGDGLVFYRAIAQLWAPLVKSGGLVAVEIGETQGPAVAELFQQRGLVDVEILQDWAGLDRVVRGKQP